MDEYRQPGLTPIIPRLQRQQGPSPLVPIIVLVIVAILRWVLMEMLRIRTLFEYESYDWSSTIYSFQSHLTFTAVLVPVCLLLAWITLGIPQVNPVRNAPPPSPFMKAITENLWASLLLLVVIIFLLMSIPVRSIFQSPWQQQVYGHTPYPVYTNPVGIRRGRPAVNGLCQELGILKRRCENWKGSSRDSVCRELALLQKRCERSRF